MQSTPPGFLRTQETALITSAVLSRLRALHETPTAVPTRAWIRRPLRSVILPPATLSFLCFTQTRSILPPKTRCTLSMNSPTPLIRRVARLQRRARARRDQRRRGHALIGTNNQRMFCASAVQCGWQRALSTPRGALYLGRNS
ncbi:hypothetical protein HYPSUDRAFT_894746 [Hypholoma sublateritium FD-334 SS-4]|uniref:Uncharacterized protein n=1 Tax=Hypholoma sublateritium (strain FD-334 SS-4) TaxID=945553 RepID=A0A0D2NRE1_HYPSF|nr:hypothetical protein HYPSUDRAFT_894746 [Hypholoma sublateritium FD-334 SS-4]